jgi:hypothetical protein
MIAAQSIGEVFEFLVSNGRIFTRDQAFAVVSNTSALPCNATLWLVPGQEFTGKFVVTPSRSYISSPHQDFPIVMMCSTSYRR